MSIFVNVALGIILFMASTLTQSQTLKDKAAAITCDVVETASTTNTCYTSGVSIRIRDEKGEENAIRAKFPIGTKIKIRSSEGGWFNVYAYGKSNDEEGWVLKTEVQPTPPSVANARQQFHAIAKTDHVARLEMAERAIALEPLNKEAHELLYTVYREMGDAATLQRAQAQHREIRAGQVVRAADEPALIFTVDNGMTSPFVQLNNQQLQVMSVANDSELLWLEQKDPTYFRLGRALHFYQRGTYKGKLRVAHKQKMLCQSDTASVVDLSGRAIDNQTIGIASNVELKQPLNNEAQEMSAEQSSEVDNLLAKALKKHGMKKPQIAVLFRIMQDPERNLEVKRLLIPSGEQQKQWLLISFVLAMDEKDAGRQIEHYGFLIARKKAKDKYQTMYSRIEDNHGGESYRSFRFLDYLDLDQDGINELIFTGYGFESWWHEAWRLKNKKWQLAAHGGGGGC